MTLEIAKKLFANLEQEGLTCCHWKSNQHLEAGLSGLTDLDLLAPLEEAPLFTKAFQDLGLIKIENPRQDYPGIEDWLGFDHQSGALIHLHQHYRLVIGEKHLKSIHLPLEQWFLNNRVAGETVPLAAPECELILLIIRTALKVDSTDIIKTALRRSAAILPAATRKEFDWLLARYDRDKLCALFKEAGLPLELERFFEFTARYSKGSLTAAYLLKTRRYFLRRLRPYCRYSAPRAFLLRTGAFLANLPVFKKAKKRSKKRLTGRTLFFALIGADGSGKSTLARDLKKWLGWKLAVNHLYFGIPRRQFFRHLTKSSAAAARAGKKVSRLLKLKPAVRFFRALEKTLNALYWLYLARYRLQKYEQALELAATGQVVMAERYPLGAFGEMKEPMDGPRIEGQGSPFLSKMAALEKACYQKIKAPPLMLVLQADLAVLKERRTEHGPGSPEQETRLQEKISAGEKNSLAEKCRAVNRLTASAGVETISAADDYGAVLTTCKQALWAQLTGPDKKRGEEGKRERRESEDLR